MLLHINGKFTNEKLKSSLLYLNFFAIQSFFGFHLITKELYTDCLWYVAEIQKDNLYLLTIIQLSSVLI